MRMEGIEPSQGLTHWILSPARLTTPAHPPEILNMFSLKNFYKLIFEYLNMSGKLEKLTFGSILAASLFFAVAGWYALSNESKRADLMDRLDMAISAFENTLGNEEGYNIFLRREKKSRGYDI